MNTSREPSLGERDSFINECYEFESNLYAFARKLCGRTTVDPNDVVANTMAVAWKSHDKVNEKTGEGLKQWLLRVAKSQFLLILRDRNTLQRGRGYLIQSWDIDEEIESTYEEETSSIKCERAMHEVCVQYVAGEITEDQFIRIFDKYMPALLPEVMEIRMGELKDINKVFFALSFFMEYTPTEIAEIRGEEMRGVQSRINRLRKLMRKNLKFDKLVAEL